MNPFYQFEVSKEKEKNGVVVEFQEGVTFTLRRAGDNHAEYQKGVKALLRECEIKSGEESTIEENFKLKEGIIALYSEHIILDWSGIDGRDGKPFKFSKKNAIDLLSVADPIYSFVTEEATKLSNFRLHEGELAIKNS